MNLRIENVRHIFSLWVLMFVFFIMIPFPSQAAHQVQNISKLKFSFVGTHFGQNSSLKFSVITPAGKVMTNLISSEHIMDDIKSTIKIKQVESGKYTVVIKNTSDTPISIIGGIAASKHLGRGKQEVQSANAMHVDLNPGDEVRHIYDIKAGFETDDQQSHLLEWNPFDWL